MGVQLRSWDKTAKWGMAHEKFSSSEESMHEQIQGEKPWLLFFSTAVALCTKNLYLQDRKLITPSTKMSWNDFENGSILFTNQQMHFLLNLENFKIYFKLHINWPPLWSNGQSFWLQIQRSRVRFPALPDFLSSSGSGTGSTQPREVNWGATWIKSRGSGP